jgi:hypothetical protein
MIKSMPHLNEIVSLAVLLLMAIALVAGEADATMHEMARAAAATAEANTLEESEIPFKTTIKAEIYSQPLTISIDAVAEFNHVRSDD